jgi:hypothetical protein
MHIDGSEKKITKSEAVRQALTMLGDRASAIDIQKQAEHYYGHEIEIRTVYQIKSNMKTGRDAANKEDHDIHQSKEKALKAEKPAKPKVATQPTNAQDTDGQAAFGNFDKLVQLLSLVKQFGGSRKVVELLEKIAV